MRPTLLALVTALALPLTLPAGASTAQAAVPANSAPSYVRNAVDDPARKLDAANDARRQVAQLMAFAQVKPGQKVVDLIPGSGYFTRVFSAIVGPGGHVYGIWPDAYDKVSGSDSANLRKLATDPHYGNVSVLVQPAAQFATPEPVDLVFTSQNYHDYPDPFMGKLDPVAFDKQVFAALKPGGLFVVVDHVAEAGSGMRDTDTLHRIDPAIVKKQVESAGFVFDGESQVLRNPKDPHDIKVFDKSIRGHTDQFVYRFRKPGG
ncbi:methyltransferase [Dyella sp.]|jgi:predicted methyltransferase|uniref:class I SAM-dependent methyltransferase n=1 Tax=Dyella sp. TaxID=1869338 RepID=UPI002D776762|nr:methyltransferase [Dyella sp.]HET6431298.1 methyltransferase [Dyella sp.]